MFGGNFSSEFQPVNIAAAVGNRTGSWTSFDYTRYGSCLSVPMERRFARDVLCRHRLASRTGFESVITGRQRFSAAVSLAVLPAFLEEIL